MASFDLIDLLAGANENLGIEFKAWMDPTNLEARAKLARHIAALANHGGGYLIFGVDDKTRKPLGATELDLALFGQDAISNIVKKYLEPRIQVLVDYIQYGEATYPVVIVPSHGARPVVAIADGPQDDRGKPIGISQGTVYVRMAGPESAPIRSADDWNTLFDRCLSHRADLLGKVLRQSLSHQSRPDQKVVAFLQAALDDTALDFTAQTRLLADKADPKYRNDILRAGTNYSALGYALIDSEGRLVEIPNPRAVNDRVSIEMHRYAYMGWSSFLPLNVPERAPQVRMGMIAGQEVTYLEGMRLENTGLISAAFDYWRIYDCGIGAIQGVERHEHLCSPAGKGHGVEQRDHVPAAGLEIVDGRAHCVERDPRSEGLAMGSESAGNRGRLQHRLEVATDDASVKA
ncbi:MULTISPECIES: helix-turn-helix domain-containing protein [unclassified Bradyrhizobium]|uniref:AlbA family DNA-binding domain-containing protein n=1 Tax=unclassified Bradyrhizobium TaxID=2631580 RepID=UPI001BA98191|nr:MULTISPECIES: ATP-binding protein [unclassified Bradyrhizobium]MBR1208190.1 ATP-binding protein [Bradyrhizobium sp. AUGA SZCCT0124]MBR1316401.1 ATP-binding protein [Bradyrhizobium sp. AUGA SZCCT0051]MBR1344704.1 ATP-binding protein [Bradyrhizobium sp. AUGA SZCCT0105]MBR1359422.1 ATP-binding protein [Bradyrhizobium sp. AUGA SZCCT0045]